MPVPLHLVSDLISVIPSNGVITIATTHRPNFQFPIEKSILCAANRRNRYGIGRSERLMLQSAYIIASKLRLLPEPLDLLLREFGGGNRGGNGFWRGFRGGGGGWNRRRRKNFRVLLLILGICCVVGFRLRNSKQVRIYDDAFLGGLGMLLLGLSVEGWKSGSWEWMLGFSCCASLVLASKKGEFRGWVTRFERLARNCRW